MGMQAVWCRRVQALLLATAAQVLWPAAAAPVLQQSPSWTWEQHQLGLLLRTLTCCSKRRLVLAASPPAQTFKVDLGNTKQIMESPAGQQVLQRGLIMAGESGIFTPEDVAFVQSGALMGEGVECVRSGVRIWGAGVLLRRYGAVLKPEWGWVAGLQRGPTHTNTARLHTTLPARSRLRRHPGGREHCEAGRPGGSSEDAAGAALSG